MPNEYKSDLEHIEEKFHEKDKTISKVFRFIINTNIIKKGSIEVNIKNIENKHNNSFAISIKNEDKNKNLFIYYYYYKIADTCP